MTDLETFRRGLQAYDDGVTQVWRTLNELLRANVSDEALRYVIAQHDPGPRVANASDIGTSHGSGA